MFDTTSVTIFLLIVAIVFVIKTINVVPQQHAWVVERLVNTMRPWARA